MHARTRLRLGVKMLKKADLRIKMQRRTSQKTRDDYFWKIFNLIIILTGCIFSYTTSAWIYAMIRRETYANLCMPERV